MKKIMSGLILAIALCSGFSCQGRYVRSVYNATPYEASVRFSVDAIGDRGFLISPGQTIKWAQPDSGPNNLLRHVYGIVYQKYVPADYGTGILDPKKRLADATDGKPSDPNIAHYQMIEYHAPAGLGSLLADEEFKFVIAGPTYEDPNNARRATYRISRASDDEHLDKEWQTVTE